jgi:hypothetical protein
MSNDGKFYDRWTRLMFHCDALPSASNNQGNQDLTNVNSGVNILLDNANYKFGGGAIKNNAVTTYVGITGNVTSLNLGAGEFTFESWVYCTTANSFPAFFYSQQAGPTWYIARYPTSGEFYVQFNGADKIKLGFIPLNQWVHIAWVRWNGKSTAYINGVAAGSVADASLYNFNGGSPSLVIAAQLGASSIFNMDEIRISNTARWIGNFIPPSAPYGDLIFGTIPQGTPLRCQNHARYLPNYGKL